MRLPIRWPKASVHASLFLSALLASSGFAQPSGIGWTGREVVSADTFLSANRWILNRASGDSIFVLSDSGSLKVRWWIGSGARAKWVQCYLYFDQPISLASYDIFGMGIRGSGLEKTVEWS